MKYTPRAWKRLVLYLKKAAGQLSEGEALCPVSKTFASCLCVTMLQQRANVKHLSTTTTIQIGAPIVTHTRIGQLYPHCRQPVVRG